jgi:hypothetical protein
MSHVTSIYRPDDLRQTAVSDLLKVILCLVVPRFEDSTLCAKQLDMSRTSHFWSRSRREKVLVPVLVLAGKSFRSRSRSQSKIFWSRSRSKKHILVPVLFRKFFGAGPSQKTFWSRDRDHFAHLYLTV